MSDKSSDRPLHLPPPSASEDTSKEAIDPRARAPRRERLLPVLTFLPQTDASVYNLISKRQFVLGRDTGCDIVLSDSRVSRTHAVIYYENLHSPERRPSCIVEDHNSRNGTYINEKRIRRPQPLHHGDTILIGSVPLGYFIRSERELGMESAPPQTVPVKSEEEIEQRVFLNLKVLVEALFPEESFTPVRFPATARDLSANGMRLVTESLSPLQYQQVTREAHYLRIRTQFPGDSQESVLRGRMAWVHYDDQRQPAISTLGVAFERMDENAHAALERFLSTL